MGEKIRLEKVTIASVDVGDAGVVAQYNPKELAIEHSIAWQDHKASKTHGPELEFTGGGSRSMTIELLFDGYETNVSVQKDVDSLLHLVTAAEMGKEGKRPHRVLVAWGDCDGRIPPFYGVIESISTKYSMFLPNGKPVRATCTVKIKEARPREMGLTGTR
jgi:hypothetical protein